ncbi:MAG: hypothetical protein AAF266_07400 [Planctomycetota bacterium]
MPTAPPPPQAAAKTVGYDDFVDERIAKTRAAVKSADLATGVTTLLAWGLGLLLLAAIADHWLVAGGFDRWERFAVFAIGLAGLGLYAVTRLGPIVMGRVNPLYAAREIERESPELKNSLLNLLQLRGNRGTAAVRATLERQAAERLASAGDAPIDHTPLVRVARLLLAIVAVIGVYVVASPKDFFASAGRVLAPWAEIAAPSRVRITELSPGAIELAQGERLNVSARVTGLEEGELVELVYTTADGRAVDRRVPMRSASGGQQYTVALPSGSGSTAALGLQGDLTYRLEAGDARTPTYRVEVMTAPTIAPTSVRYDYPAYTGYSTREVEGVGDLRAVEGTRVTINAAANLPIDSAQIDLNADGRPDARMRVEGDTATGVLILRRSEAGGSPESYVLRFTSIDGQANNDPPQYRIEVIADLPPETEIRQPEETVIDLAVNERVRIVGEARDPDFALSGVKLIGEANGRRVVERELMRGDGRGLVNVSATVTPESLGLRPGDVMTYWIAATDNRTPKPNVGTSERRQLRVIGSAEQGPGDPGQGEGEPSDGNDPNARPQPGRPGEKPQDQPGGQNGGEQGGAGEQQNPPGGESAPNPGGEQRPNEKQADESGESGDEGDSLPPGGLTGAGEEGGDDSSERNGDASAEGSLPPKGDPGNNATGNQAGSEQGNSPETSTGNNSSPGANGEGGDGEPQETKPVPNNGTDDGSAFDRIREFLEGSESNGEAKPSESGDSRDPSDLRRGETSEGKPDNGDASGRQDDSGAPQPNDPADSPADRTDGAGAEGDGREGSDAGTSKPRDGASGKQPERPDNGPGAGEQDRQGSQSSSKSSDTGGESPPGETTDPNTGPRQGADGAGQGEAADQGAGQSADQGAGDSSGRPGKQQQADSPTGKPGGENAGDGNSQRDATDGDRPGDRQGDGESGKRQESGEDVQPGEAGSDRDSARDGSPLSGDSGDNDTDDSKRIEDRRGEGADQQPGGRPNDLTGPQELVDRGPTSDAAGQGSEVGGDDANLEYAREQTDLVLERLEEQLQQREVDRRLLDKLGWTEQDLRRFVDRWRSRQKKAATRGAEGEAELDRALRSLGLGQQGPSKTRSIAEDQLRDLRQNARTKAPPRWRAAQQRYNRSLNASGDAAAEE